jgi:metallophosphoesterase superfamily enzyme
MKVRVINDWHLYGVDPVGNTAALLSAIDNSPYPVVLNGDNFDFVNAKPESLMALEIVTNSILKRVDNKNVYFVRGNHCTNKVKAPDEARIGNVYFTHGDIWMWGLDRASDYRSKSHGAGWFKRNLISRPLSKLRHLVQVRPNKRLIENITKHQKHNPEIKFYVFGHSHPPKDVWFKVENSHCVILKRGVNDLELV